ncbi:RNA-directed DNA polymerase, eukaryota, reverse transcriptase zinc-binding domain protein [Tanacetum coccineum]
MLESLRGHFFNGHEIGSNKATWVKWEKVLTAKDKGGLGVASLYALNRGLLVKWFWRFYNQETSLWKKVIQAIHGRDGNVHSINKSAVHSCWTTIVKEIRRLGVSGLNIFDFMKQKVGNGNIIKFWTDNWYHGGILKDIYPRLYALENRKDITVSSKLADPHLNTSFRRDIRGGCELEQFQMLVDLVDSITLAPMEDRWVWNLEGSGEFSVASIRRKIDDSRLPTIGDKTRWVKFVPIKINVFAWKVTVNALPTRYNLSRRGMDIQSLSCPMCDCGIESTDHVFVGCDVSRQLGRMISNWWNTPLVEMDTIAVWKTWFSSIRLAPNLKSIFEGGRIDMIRAACESAERRHIFSRPELVLDKQEVEGGFKYTQECVRLESEVTALEELLEMSDCVAQQPVDCSFTNVVWRLNFAKTTPPISYYLAFKFRIFCVVGYALWRFGAMRLNTFDATGKILYLCSSASLSVVKLAKSGS